jgi:endonuclease/exonuclease/phosphatase family metal-dependent hydrolase
MIICGDMNNSAYSYVYRSIKGKLKDSFEEAGKGFEKPISSDIIQLELITFLLMKK